MVLIGGVTFSSPKLLYPFFSHGGVSTERIDDSFEIFTIFDVIFEHGNREEIAEGTKY
jgi:hypothetical protein